MAGIRVNIRAQVPQADLNRVEMQFNKVMNRMSGKEVAFNINGRSFTQPLGRITAQANEFTKSLEASNARVIAFGASVGIINAVSDAFKGLVAETVKFEKTLADINVILNSSNQGLQKFGDNLFKVAKNTAQSFNVVATAALEFSRQGLSMEETLKRTNDALILTRLTSLKAEEAVSGLTAAVNAFAETGLTTTNIIDKLAAVDVRFAVSSEDLIHALERTGAVAIDAGVELNDLIGLVTALQQTTARGGAVIGNGLKTIFTRIQRPESIRQIEELGVSVRNLTGAVLPADKILLNMAKSFDKMTQAQQSNVVQFSAGIFQANVFRAALRDLAKDSSLYEQASKVAGDAAGEAALKNEKLNKTLAALASQSSSAVRELAGVLGDLMVKPELGTFMEGFISTVEGLKNALGGGEEEGSTFAKGFVRGIGNILTGPGLLAFGAVFVKMLMNVGKFASQSIKDVLGIVDKKEKVRQMEEAIVKVLSQNKSIQEGLNELEGDRVAQERFMLKIIEAQTNAMVKQKQIASSLASPLLRSGINTDLTVDSNDFVDLDKNAKIDSFGAKGVIPRSTVHREKQGAMQAGYQPGPVDAMEVKGMGRVVYNRAETVKQFPGMDQPAIMPPSSSRAGKSYKKNFHKQHGFDPYSELSAEKYAGFIPNYSKIGLKNNVTENQERMHLRGTPYQNLPDYVLKDIGGAANLAGANIKFKVKTSSFTGKIGDIGKYLNALGVDHVETTIPFDFVDLPVTSKGKMTKAAKVGLTTGTTKQRGNYAEGQFLKSDAGKGYFSTAADDQAVVDGISESGAPTEVKAASIDLQNILSKSIRRYSNQKFRETLMSVVSHHKDVTRSTIPNNLLEGFSTNGEIADALSSSVAKLEEDSIVKNLSTLARMGQYTIPGMSPEEVKSSIQKQSFRQELLSRGIGQSEKDLLMKYGMSGGFIPNYRNFYQMFYGNDFKPAGMDIGHKVGARENWGHHHDYILSEADADDMLKEEFSRRGKLAAKSPNPQEYMQRLFNSGIGNMYIRKYSMDDSDYAQLSSGIYSDSNATILSKILTGLPWADGKSNRRSVLGTKLMPFKLATTRSFPHIPFNGRNALTFPDVFANNKAGIPPELDSKNIWSTSEKLNKTFMKDMGMEQETIEEYFDEKDFIKLLAKSAGDREPEALRAGRAGGIQGVKDFIDEARMYKGYIPNFIKWHDRPGGGSKIPKPDNPGLFTKQEVEELKSMGYKRTDSHGWHYAEPVGIKHTPPTKLAPFGLAGPMSFDFLSRMIQHDRETYSIPNSLDDNPDLDTLGKSLTSEAGQKNPVIVGYDSTVNRMQLIEGNHRVAAIARLNKNRDKTQKFYSGIHGYVAGAKLRSQGDMDHSVGFVNQQIYPPKIPDDIVQAMKDPYRAPGQFVQGSWAPSDFGIPNFADFWDNPYFNEKAKVITDKETGTTLKYKNLSPGYADITHTQRGKSDKKGGAFRNFNKLVSQYDSIGSGMLVPQRAGIGPTPWAKLVHMFPQMKNRIQKGLETMGDFRIDDTEFPFKSLVGLKKDYTSLVRQIPDIEVFVEEFDSSPFFEDGVALENLSTYKVKGKGDGAAGFKSKGLVPNFFNPIQSLSKTYKRVAGRMTNPDKVVLMNKIDHVMPKNPKESWAAYEDRHLSFLKNQGINVRDGNVLNYGKTAAVDGFVPPANTDGKDVYLTLSEAKSGKFRNILVGDKFIRGPYENMESDSPLWGGKRSPFENPKKQTIHVTGHLVKSKAKGLIPNFYNLNRRNLSDGDKMSDRQRLLKMWQDKMAEVKKVAKSGKPRAEIDPIISKKNAEANEIWEQIQKCKKGLDYYIPNYVDLEKVRQLAIRGVGGEKENAQRILNKRSIKSKNMFHDIIIDSFLDNPNQDYPNPGTSIIDYLIKSPPDGLGYDEDLIRSAAKNPKGYRRAAKGLIPNFENVHLKRGQTDPNAPLMQPSINPMLYKPILAANTPEEVYEKLMSFMQAHATGHFSGRSSMGTTGQLGKKLEDYISKYFAYSDGSFQSWEESSDPYGGKWIDGESLAKNEVHESGMMSIGSGAVSFTTRDAIADQFHRSKLHGGKAKGKIHEVTVPRKNIFGKKKLLRMLNMGAKPPRYPMVDKLKASIRDGSFFNYWKGKGGLFINIDGERNDRSLIDLDKELDQLRPELGKGEIRTSMFTRRMPTIAPHIDRKSGDFYNEQEVTRIVNKGLVPNFARLTSRQLNKLERNRKQQRDRVEGKREFLGDGLTDYEKGLAESIFDYFLSNISGLSQGFRFDPSTLSLRATASDFTKIFRHTKSSKNQQILSDLAGGNSRLVNKILNNYMMHHTESMLHAKGQYKLEPDPLMQGAMFGGLVPSFSNPLMDAINREKAAGIPSHRIKIEKSSQLRSPQNPAGLAVTNTRDEPGGVAQGIRRAKMMKIDPKKHGAVKKFTPNFNAQTHQSVNDAYEKAASNVRVTTSTKQAAPAAPVDTSEHQEAHDKMAQSIISSGKEYSAGMDGIIAQLGETEEDLDIKDKINNFRTALDNAAKNFDKSGDAASVIHDTGLQAAKKEVDMAVVGQAESSDPKRAKAGAEARKAMREMSKSTANAAAGLKELDKSQESSLQNLFFMQSAISLVNGQLQEFAETGGATTKALAAFGMGLSNTVASFIQAKELGGMLSQMAGNTDEKGRSDGTSFTLGNLFGEGRQERIRKTNTVNQRLADKRAARQPGFIGRKAAGGGGLGRAFAMIGKAGRVLGMVGKFGSRLIPIVGQLYTGFTAVNEIFKLFNDGEGIMSLFESASDKAAKKLEKLGAISEAAASALEAVKNNSKIQDELTELQVKGSARTRAENERYLDLQIQSLDAKSKETEALAKLTDESVVGKRGLELYNQHMAKAGSTTADTVKAIQELQLATKFLAIQQQQIVSFEKALDSADKNADEEAVARRAGAGLAFSLEDMLTKRDASGKVDKAATQSNIDLFKNFNAQDNRDGFNIDFRDFASKLQLNDGVNQDNISTLMQEFFQVIEDNEIDAEKIENEQTQAFVKAIGDQLQRSGVTSEGRKLFAENTKFKKLMQKQLAAETKRLDIININLKHAAELAGLSRQMEKAQHESVKAQGLLADSIYIRAERNRQLAGIEEKETLKTQAARAEFNKKLYGAIPKILEAGKLGSGLNQEGGMTPDQLTDAQLKFNKRARGASLLTADRLNTDKNSLVQEMNQSLPDDFQIKISEAQAEEARKIMDNFRVSLSQGEDGSMQKQLTELAKKLTDVDMDEMTKLAVMTMLKMTDIVQLEIDQEKILSDSIAALKQKHLEIKNSTTVEKQKLKQDLAELNIKERTVAGAVELQNRIRKHVDVGVKIEEELMGEAANLMVLNQSLKNQLGIEQKAEALRAKSLQELIKSSRDEGSALNNNALGNIVKGLALSSAGNSSSGLKDLNQLQQNLTNQITLKLTEEITGAEFAAKESALRATILQIQGVAARQAKAKSNAEQFNLEMATQEMAERILYNEQSQTLNRTVEMQLQQEIMQALESKKTLELKREALEKNNERYMLAMSQHDTEMEELRASVQNTKDKLAIATLKGDIRKQAELQLEEELANSQKSALIAAQNELILSGKSQLAGQIKRANELQEMTNKVSEMRLAKDKAFVDQKTLEVNARASNTTSKLSAFSEMRTAGTKASMTGNADDLLAAAQAQLAYNRALTGTTSALDQVNVELANIEVAASNLGSDLVSTAFSTTKTELKNVFHEIAGGTKTIGDAFKDMGLNVASALADRLMDHNIDSIMKNLTFAFTGKKPKDEADKMRNAIQNGHLYGVGELRKQAAESSEALGNMLKSKMQEVKLDINVDVPSIKDLESQMNTYTQSVADGFTKSSSAVQEALAGMLGDTSTFQMLMGKNNENLALLNKSIANLNNKFVEEEVKTLDPWEGIPDQGATNPTTVVPPVVAQPPEPVKPPEPKVDFAAMVAEYERRRTGAVSVLKGEDNLSQSAINLAMYGTNKTTTLGAGRNTRKIQTVDLNALQERYNFLHELSRGELFNHDRKGGKGLNHMVFKGSEQKVGGRNSSKTKMVLDEAMVYEPGNYAARTIDSEKVRRATQEASGFNSGDSYMQQLRDLQDFGNKLKRAKELEASKGEGAAEALARLKEAADKLGIELAKINVPTTKPITEYEGGKIQKYHQGGFVRGYKKGGEVPAILQEGEYVIPRKLAKGGRLKAGITGLGQSAASTAGSYLANKWWGDDDKVEDNKPTFDTKRFNTLGLDSDVNMRANDPRLSARFRAENQATQDYGQYLLDMEDYKNQKINEKFQKRMGYLRMGLGVVASAATNFAVQGLTLAGRAAVDGARNLGGSMGIGKKENVAAYKAAKEQGFDVNYSQVAAINKQQMASGKDFNPDEINVALRKAHESNTRIKAVNRQFLNPKNLIKSNKKGNQDSDSTGFFAKVFGTKAERDAKKARKNELVDLYKNQGKYKDGGFSDFIGPVQRYSGGSIPAMLTKGEAVIPSAIASRIGYNNLNKMNTTGDFPIVDGKGGIDNVGPVGMNPGDFVIRKSSTDKLKRTNPNLMRFAAQNPDGFRRAAKGYYNGGIVDSELTYPSQSMGGGSYGTRQSPELSPQPETGGSGSTTGSSGGAVTNNINVNVTIDKSGGEVSTESSDTQGEASSYNNEKQLSQKIKAAVLDVIRQEKRVGGELS